MKLKYGLPDIEQGVEAARVLTDSTKVQYKEVNPPESNVREADDGGRGEGFGADPAGCTCCCCLLVRISC